MALKNPHRGRYNNDYSPKYSDPYDIYEKAKNHVKELKKKEEADKKKKDSEKEEA